MPALSVDPFSGKTLLMKREDNGYAVYSVGTNRTDDGASEVDRPFVGTFPNEHPADVGVRVQYR